MAVPKIVNDGNFAVPQINGTPGISYPFVNEGDSISWEYRPRYRVDQASYKEPVMMSKVNTPKGLGYLIDPGQVDDVGQGLYEYTPTIASLPVNRVVGRTITALFQERTGLIIWLSFQLPTLAQVLTEYATSPLPPYSPPIILNNSLNPIVPALVAFGTWAKFNITGSSGGLSANSQFFGAPATVSMDPVQIPGTAWVGGDVIVSQASKCDIYKAGFYYRETYFITYPNFIQL